jgi:hypothetical protein
MIKINVRDQPDPDDMSWFYKAIATKLEKLTSCVCRIDHRNCIFNCYLFNNETITYTIMSYSYDELNNKTETILKKI